MIKDLKEIEITLIHNLIFANFEDNVRSDLKAITNKLTILIQKLEAVDPVHVKMFCEKLEFEKNPEVSLQDFRGAFKE